MDKVYILAMKEEEDSKTKRLIAIEDKIKSVLSDKELMARVVPPAGHAVVFGDKDNGWQITIAPNRVSFSKDSQTGHDFQEVVSFDLKDGELVCLDEPMNSTLVKKGEKGLERMLMMPDFDELMPNNIEESKIVPKKWDED